MVVVVLVVVVVVLVVVETMYLLGSRKVSLYG